MCPIKTPIRIVFAREFSDMDVMEALHRGCLSHVMVEIDGRGLYPVFFYDAVRLCQDLESSAEQGDEFLAESGMIVLKEVTPEAMQLAAEGLFKQGFLTIWFP